jgi:hypothetical protein
MEPRTNERSYASLASHTPATVTDDCKAKVLKFCDQVLKIKPVNLNIIRAHRVGKPIPGKTRPIVAKLDEDSKSLIKSALKGINLRFSPYNVSDQFPPEVKERRKELIPTMLKARREGKRAVLVRDKLIINNVEYKGPLVTETS